MNRVIAGTMCSVHCVLCRVVALTCAAVYHAYKLVHLQAMIDAYLSVITVDAKFADAIHR